MMKKRVAVGKATSRKADVVARATAKRSRLNEFGNIIIPIKITIDSRGKPSLPHGVHVKDAAHWWFDDKRHWVLFQIRKTRHSGKKASHYSAERSPGGKIDLRRALAEIGLTPKSVEGLGET